MKNLDRLLIVLAIFIALACKCQSDLFGRKSGSQQNYSTSNTSRPPANVNKSPTPDFSDLGEYRQCSERASLNYNQAGGPAQLVVNNKSQFTITVYRLGANHYQSKYETLTPGKSVTLRSPARGEWWMVADVSGNCQMIVSPPNVVNVN